MYVGRYVRMCVYVLLCVCVCVCVRVCMYRIRQRNLTVLKEVQHSQFS